MALTLESDNMRYVETFQLEPPSLHVSLPLPEGAASERTGGPPAPGLYARQVIAVTADGDEKDDGQPRSQADIGTGGPGCAGHTSPPLRRSQPLLTSGDQHLEGLLQVQDSCIFIRNGEIPVWPSGFSVGEQDGQRFSTSMARWLHVRTTAPP